MSRRWGRLAFSLVMEVVVIAAFADVRGQDQEPSATAARSVTETTLDVLQLRSDFDLFRRALEEAHAGLYRYTTKREMDTEFAQAEARLVRPMTILEFRNVLARVLATIKCGHTYIMGEEVSAVLDSAALFPLSLLFESTRAFVLLNRGLDERAKPGMEVLAINGEPIAAILERILPNVRRDGDIRTGQLHRLAQWQQWGPGSRPVVGFSQYYRLHIGNPRTFRTLLRDPQTRRIIEVELAGTTNADGVTNVGKNTVNHDVLTGITNLGVLNGAQALRFRDDDSTAILRLPSFGGDDVTDFLRKAFAELKTRPAKRLVIDLRNNGGGSDRNGALLFSYLTSQEFGYYERIHMNTYEPSFQPHTDFRWSQSSDWLRPDPNGGWLLTERKVGVSVQQPSTSHFDGPVYVLIDGGSFSATADFAATADFHKRATFIGEETGGAAEGNNGLMIRLTLPESKLLVGIPAYAYFNYVDPSNRRRGTLPTYAVRQTIDDLEKGRDTVLEFTLELIRNGKAPDRRQ